MRVHLIKKQTVEDFVKTNVQSRNSFEDWLEKIKYADWENLMILRLLMAARICWVKAPIELFLILGATTTG